MRRYRECVESKTSCGIVRVSSKQQRYYANGMIACLGMIATLSGHDSQLMSSWSLYEKGAADDVSLDLNASTKKPMKSTSSIGLRLAKTQKRIDLLKIADKITKIWRVSKHRSDRLTRKVARRAIFGLKKSCALPTKLTASTKGTGSCAEGDEALAGKER